MQNPGPSQREGALPDDNTLRNPEPPGRTASLKQAPNCRRNRQSWHVDAGRELGRQPAPYCQPTRRGKDRSSQLPVTYFTTGISFNETSILPTRRAMRIAEALTKHAAQDECGAVLFAQM